MSLTSRIPQEDQLKDAKDSCIYFLFPASGRCREKLRIPPESSFSLSRVLVQDSLFTHPLNSRLIIFKLQSKSYCTTKPFSLLFSPQIQRKAHIPSAQLIPPSIQFPNHAITRKLASILPLVVLDVGRSRCVACSITSKLLCFLLST